MANEAGNKREEEWLLPTFPWDAQRGLHSAEMAHEPVLWLSYVS